MSALLHNHSSQSRSLPELHITTVTELLNSTQVSARCEVSVTCTVHPLLFISSHGISRQTQQTTTEAVTAGNGPVLVVAGPGPEDARADPAHRLSHRGRRRPPVADPGGHIHQQSREGDGRRASVACCPTRQPKGSCWARSTRSARAFCAEKRNICRIGSNFVIFDTDDQERIVKAVIRELNINEKLYRPASVHGAISRAKNELIGPDDYPTTDVS